MYDYAQNWRDANPSSKRPTYPPKPYKQVKTSSDQQININSLIWFFKYFDIKSISLTFGNEDLKNKIESIITDTDRPYLDLYDQHRKTFQLTVTKASLICETVADEPIVDSLIRELITYVLLPGLSVNLLKSESTNVIHEQVFDYLVEIIDVRDKSFHLWLTPDELFLALKTYDESK